jgi:hypothetical protein
MKVLKAKQMTIDLREIGELELMFQYGMLPIYEVLLGYWHPPTAITDSAS